MQLRGDIRRTGRPSAVLIGAIVAANILIRPAAAQSFGEAVCAVNGVGRLIMITLTGAGVYLVYLAILDGYKGFKQGKMKSTGQRAEQGSYYEDAVKKGIGGVMVPGIPAVLGEIGFTLLPCVRASSIFAMATPVSPVSLILPLPVEVVAQILLMW